MNLFDFGTVILKKYPAIGGVSSRVFNAISWNRIRIDSSTFMDLHISFLKKCKIRIIGKNNRIIFGNHCYLEHLNITIYGNNNNVILGENVCCYNTEIHIEDDGGTLQIGDHTLICGTTHLAVIEGCKIEIGKNCLFSKDITFRTGDSHSILDMNGKRINKSESITIGDRVWIGNKVIILKGTNVKNDSVVSTGAILTKSIKKSNVIIGGVPARIIKDNIMWDRRRL